jgi:DNA (cytosine-5)-methyltransferase 1
VHGVAHAFKVRGGCEGGGKGYLGSDDVAFTISTTQDQQVAHSVVAPTLTAANDPSRSPQSSEVTQQVYSVLQASMAVRRLTPVECERLQGFADGYTDIQPKGKATPDGPRYKALGNSMAVPVMGWIGKRIQEVDAILKNS